jgi:hypothetical protein
MTTPIKLLTVKIVNIQAQKCRKYQLQLLNTPGSLAEQKKLFLISKKAEWDTITLYEQHMDLQTGAT